MSFGEPSQVTHFNRKRWKYTITWQVMVVMYRIVVRHIFIVNGMRWKATNSN